MDQYISLLIAAWYAASTAVVFASAVFYCWFMLEAELEVVAPLCDGEVNSAHFLAVPQISRTLKIQSLLTSNGPCGASH
jgi:hypothetical protein